MPGTPALDGAEKTGLNAEAQRKLRRRRSEASGRTFVANNRAAGREERGWIDAVGQSDTARLTISSTCRCATSMNG